jgi:hypothetical protein
VRARAWTPTMLAAAAAGCATAPRPAPPQQSLPTSFLTGSWAGEAQGAYAQENWGPAHDGRMIGCYRESADGAETAMFELMEIDAPAPPADAATPAAPARLRIRHFDAAMTPWRSEPGPLTLRLAASSPGRALFKPDGASPLASIEYALDGDELTATVTFAPGRDRAPIVVRMRRVRP